MIQTKKIDNMQEIKSFALFIAPKIFEDSKRYVKFFPINQALLIKSKMIFLDFALLIPQILQERTG